uniref:Uncharacterized protein n=1 Tax=Micrurus lemniscatus lemniscatus TaxID=129467 RepID=A0A2D4IXW9_MICLE
MWIHRVLEVQHPTSDALFYLFSFLSLSAEWILGNSLCGFSATLVSAYVKKKLWTLYVFDFPLMATQICFAVEGKLLSITKIPQDKSNLGISKNDFQMIEAKKKALVKGRLSTEYIPNLFKVLFLDFASNIRMQNIFNALFLEPA